MVVARFYTEVDVGFASAAISALTLITMLSLVGLDFSLIRFLPQAKKPQELINSCFTLGGITSLVVVSVFIASLDLWSPALSFIKENAAFCAVFIATAVIGLLSYLVDSTFIAKRKASFTLSKNTIFSLLKIPLPILFVLFFHSFGIVASWGIALGIAVAVSLIIFLPKVQNSYKPVPTLKLNLIKDMWQYSGGNYLASLFTAVPATVLPIMVVNLLGPVQNAYFYIAWMMATLLFTIPLSVSQSLFAESSHFEDKLRENIIKSVKFTSLLLVPAVILLVLVGKWLLLAFGQSYSANALHLLWILAISSLPLSITFIYSTILRVTGRVKELIAIWAFIAIAALVVSYLVMPSTGIIGIGYAWLGVQGAVAIYILITRQLYRS
jgi:O-antigen/teichoic acid export membrane protein